jgi:hypothetical protein
VIGGLKEVGGARRVEMDVVVVLDEEAVVDGLTLLRRGPCGLGWGTWFLWVELDVDRSGREMEGILGTWAAGALLTGW